MRKADKVLLERINVLETKIKLLELAKDKDYLARAEHRIDVTKEAREITKRVEEYAFDLGRVLSIYKKVLMKSGVITNCEADRSEYQWDESNVDPLHRNFHFKVNKVVIQKESE